MAHELTLQDIQSLLDSRIGDLQIYISETIAAQGVRLGVLEIHHAETLANRIRFADLERRMVLLEAAAQKSGESVVITSVLKWLGMVFGAALITYLVTHST